MILLCQLYRASGNRFLDDTLVFVCDLQPTLVDKSIFFYIEVNSTVALLFSSVWKGFIHRVLSLISLCFCLNGPYHY